MDKNLRSKALIRLLFNPILIGSLLFLSAGTINYWQGWIFLIVFVTASTVHTFYLMKNDPALLERRMRAGAAAEKRITQRIIITWMIGSFCFLLIVSGFDYRLGWSHLPAVVVVIGNCLVGLSFVVFYMVCRENSFASATVEVAENQKVISTGLYSVVRHPMYSGALLLLFGMPLALGSLWAMTIAVVLFPFLIWRIVDEEKFLAMNLNGYIQYCDKVKYRLIPGIY